MLQASKCYSSPRSTGKALCSDGGFTIVPEKPTAIIFHYTLKMEAVCHFETSYLPIQLHGIIIQKIITFLIYAKTSNIFMRIFCWTLSTVLVRPKYMVFSKLAVLPVERCWDERVDGTSISGWLNFWTLSIDWYPKNTEERNFSQTVHDSFLTWASGRQLLCWICWKMLTQTPVTRRANRSHWTQ
jgi:hypothetical protein